MRNSPGWLACLWIVGLYLIVAPSISYAQAPVLQGLRGDYYEWDPGLGGTPDRLEVFKPENLVLSRIDPVVNFGWGGGPPDPFVRADQFAVRWTGQVIAPSTEEFTFSIVGDDGVVLWLSDKPIDPQNPGDPITDPGGWKLQGDTEYTSDPIPLEKGKKYYLMFEMYENGGGATARLRWESPSMPKQPIPASQLIPAIDPNDKTPPNTINDLKVTETTVSTVTLTWTAPGGDADQYDLRVSFVPITEENFSKARRIRAPRPASANTKETFTVLSLDPLQSYYFAIKAVDKNLNASALSNVVNANTLGGDIGDGLKGEYYEWDPGLGGTPDRLDVFQKENLKLTRIDPVVNFGWGGGSPDPSVRADQFAVRWTGLVKAPASEEFTFYIVGDDGVVLWLSDKPIDPQNPGDPITDPGGWRLQGDTEYKSEPIKLEKDKKYYLMFEMYENGGGATARLRWSSNSFPKQAIPQAFLFSKEGLKLGRVSGLVTDPQNKPIANAVVTIAAADRKVITATDALGFYSALMPEGKVDVSVEATNLEALQWFGGQGSVEVKGGELALLNFTLTPNDFIQNLVLEENFDKGNTRGWKTDVPESNPGKWEFADGKLKASNSDRGGVVAEAFDRVFLPDVGSDLLMTVKITPLKIGEGPFVRIGLTAHDQGGEFPGDRKWLLLWGKVRDNPLGLALLEEAVAWRNENLNVQLEMGKTYNFKFLTFGLRALGKVWEDGTPEPAEWQVRDNFGSNNGGAKGIALVGVGADALYDDLKVFTLVKGEAKPPALPQILCGDANQDGKVAVPDAILALQIAVGTRKATDAQLSALDFNGNGKVDISEVILVLRKAVNPAFKVTGKACQ